MSSLGLVMPTAIEVRRALMLGLGRLVAAGEKRILNCSGTGGLQGCL